MEIRFFFILLSILVFFSKSAFAYIDPGSTAFIIQSIIAAIVGFFVALNLYWFRFKSFVKKIFSKFRKKNKL
tara:strand:+ start:69 stop:284 length:216 start_codon:yes stop_codon:yes gene_type:complete